MADFLKLKKSNCKSCYKCIRNCPVKSIRFSGGQANIIGAECILCGHCFVVCPQNAKQIVSSVEQVKVLLSEDTPVFVSLAPSFAANYEGAGIESMREAIKKLGFAGVDETAIGATIVKREYDRILHEEKRDILISSCCHSINLLIQKYFPSELQYLADVVSPMQAHCLEIKKQNPGCKTVFIGPCVAKKDEADAYSGIVDAVLTFEELTAWLNEEGIEIKSERDQNPESRARFFPTTGGILKTMSCDMPDYSYFAIDGVENCIAALKDIEKGGLHKCFIEMSACIGSCSGGPVMEKYHRTPIRDYLCISSYAGKYDFPAPELPKQDIKKFMPPILSSHEIPTESEIKDILHQMGKTMPEHELNCGSCGYNSCREKAVAVFQGKAEITMCLPFLNDRAERFSDNIINNTPNAIIVLNDSLEVQQINGAALKLMNIASDSHVLGEPAIRILDFKDFLYAQQSGRPVMNKRTYLAEYKKYVDETITYDKNYHLLICIMRDVTDEETELEKKDAIARQTVETTDKVIDKQMRVVQEIASLLGETAAETKIALTKLKESINNE